MGILKQKNRPNDSDNVQLKSIKLNREKVDRDGIAWKKADIWLRKDYLNKLKVLGHFIDVSVGDLINRALGEYIAREYDKSRAMEKLVANKPKKVKI